MMEEDEEEYEIEESVLVVELQGIMETGFLGQVKQAKVLGINTDKPMLQLDDYTFSGEYQDAMGTCMLFEDDTQDDDDEDKALKYSCLTNKKLCMQRVFLKDNAEQSTSQDEPPSEPTEAETSNQSSKPTVPKVSAEQTPESEMITDSADKT